jgi:hypothetical protein
MAGIDNIPIQCVTVAPQLVYSSVDLIREQK